MGSSWSRVFRSLLCNGQRRNCFPLRFPPHCKIGKISVIQVSSGPKTSFKVDLYNSEKPCRDASASSGGGDAGGDYEADPLSYQVLPQLEGQSGLLDYYDVNGGVMYSNQDGDGPSTRKHLIHIEINPASDGDFAFDVGFICEVDR